MWFTRQMLYIKNKSNNNGIIVEKFSLLLFIHIASIVGLFTISDIKYKTILYHICINFLSMLSITGGYHRLWSHRSYCARIPLQIFYFIFSTTATQNSAIEWCKQHRTHHRCEEKPGDPYNINKGFYHAHIGWIYKHKDQKEYLEYEKTDVSDLTNNKLLLFQYNYYIYCWTILNIFCNFYILGLWNETVLNIIFSTIIRITCTLNITWCINSFSHTIGVKPNRKDIRATDHKVVAYLTLGEGWHNYHHSYPKDYRASRIEDFNITTKFIDFTRRIGLSYNHHIKGNENISIENRFDTSHYDRLH